MVRVAGLLDQVLAGPRGAARRTGARRSRRWPTSALRVLELTAAQSRLWRDELCPALAAEGILVGTVEDATPSRAAGARARLRASDLPGPDARSRSGRDSPSRTSPGCRSVSASSCATSDSGEERFARVKVPEGLSRFVGIGSRGTAAAARVGDLALPRRALPGDGGARARRLPRHARRRHRDLRRRRRPARGGRERAAEAAVRRGRPARGLELDLPRDARRGSSSGSACSRPASTRSTGCSTSPTSLSSTRSTGPTSSTSRGSRTRSAAWSARRTTISSPRSPSATSSCSTRTTRSRRASRRSSARRARRSVGGRAQDDRLPDEPRLGARAGA